MSTEHITFAAVFGEIAGSQPARPATIRAAFEAILAGAWTSTQIGGFVVALRIRGETAGVITAAVEAMRSAMIAVDHGLEATLDTCGTGGDGLCTLNVSTAAAVVVASLGVSVAKHGNRAVSSRSGSADVVEALGVPIDIAADRQAAVLRDAGIAFLFAPTHHPAMKHAAATRRELGIRTIFNVLGPLANPARATHQLLGTYDDALRAVMAETLRALGTRRAWVVRGEDGSDEVSPSGPTRVTELDGDRIQERIITPEDFGLARVAVHAMGGGDSANNARAIESILRGEPHPAKSAVVLNAAAAAVVARGGHPKDAAAQVEETIASGRAFATLERWRAAAARARAT
ncbi:MAG TPA: anthranilate phosphoribosyltransferase [Polyangiaceae bacterium]|nr:anthranilate phosphoribosyltransferase [Polyangiaceae bacterium]